MAENEFIIIPAPKLEDIIGDAFDDFEPGEWYAGIQRRSKYRRWQFWVKTFLNLIVSLVGDGFFVYIVFDSLFNNKIAAV